MSDKQQIGAITILKGILCLSIFLHHAAASVSINTGVFGWFGRYGGSACSFFFVISGFLLSYRYRPVETWRDWLALVKRRVMHLLPIHYFTLLFCVVVFVVTGRSLAGYTTGILGTCPSLFLVQDWIPYHPEIRQCWDGVAWYILALFFCYLVYPFVFNHVRKFVCAGLALAGFLIIAIAFSKNTGLINVQEYVYFFPPTRFLEFVMGSFVAYFIKEHRVILGFYSLAILSSISIFGVWCAPLPVGIGFVTSPVFALLLYGCLVMRSVRSLANSLSIMFKPLHWIGIISLEVYMFHAIVLALAATLVHKILHSNSANMIALVGFIGSVLSSLLWRELNACVSSLRRTGGR